MSDSSAAGVPIGWMRYNWLVTALVGVFSAASTIWLNLSNDRLKTRLDEASLMMKRQEQEFDQRLRDKASALEESRERVARYDFVSRTLAAVDPNENSYKLTLAVNIVRLALSPAEQTGLFANLELASDSMTKQVGKLGRELVQQSQDQARKLQNDGFEAMTKGEWDQAHQLFQKAEAQAPGEGVSYEMERLLRRNANAPAKSERTILKQVEKNYLQFAPPATREALQQRAKQLDAAEGAQPGPGL